MQLKHAEMLWAVSGLYQVTFSLALFTTQLW
ncbi:Uncharacterised protein [Vibrio cholerae]|nr:Uncharacterised protein [Vibrio cholerae]